MNSSSTIRNILNNLSREELIELYQTAQSLMLSGDFIRILGNAIKLKELDKQEKD